MEMEKETRPNDNEVRQPAMVGEKRKMTGAKMVLIVFVIVVISSICGAFFGFMSSGLAQRFAPRILQKISGTTAGKDIIRQQVVEEDSAVIDVVEKTSPAVVSIVISKNLPTKQGALNPFDFPNFFGLPFGNPGGNQGNGSQSQQIGGGSGFLVGADGLVVTNRHVVDDAAADYTVVTSDGKEYPAKVLAKDPINDIALLKIDGNGFPTLNLGDSDAIKIGQTAIAIGNSLGEFSNTVSKGIISGLQRNLTAGGGLSGGSEQLRNIIQTDAAINPGNSGGPLLDINGSVIGINVAMAQGAQNIGFAIPANQVKKVVDQVKNTGKISTPYLGVRYIPIDSVLQKSNNLPFNYGALVLRGQNTTDLAVIPGSPADKAGIVENDIILEINGTKIDQNNSLSDLISGYNVGDTITLKIWEKGNEKTIQVTLAELKQ